VKNEKTEISQSFLQYHTIPSLSVSALSSLTTCITPPHIWFLPSTCNFLSLSLLQDQKQQEKILLMKREKVKDGVVC
jgi:hypothetical protein